MVERPGHSHGYMDAYDPLDSPGYYQKSSVLQHLSDMGSGIRATDLLPSHEPSPEDLRAIQSLRIVDSFIFPEEQRRIIIPIQKSDRGYVTMTIPADHLIRQFKDDPYWFQVRIDKKDYKFSLSSEEQTILKPLSKIETARRSLAQFLKDGR